MKLQIQEIRKKIIKEFNFKTGQEITEFDKLTDVLLLADVFRIHVEDSQKNLLPKSFAFNINIRLHSRMCFI